MKPTKIVGLAVIFALLVSTMAPALAMPPTFPNSGMDNSSPPDFPLIVDGKIVREETHYIGGKYPIGVHLLKKDGSNPDKMKVLLAGTGSDFKTTFMIPENQNLVVHYLKQGYLVVGIDDPETLLEFNPDTDYSFMKNWGIKKHMKDARKVVTFAQKETGIKDYDLAGFSMGGIIAAVYGSYYHHDKHLGKISGLDLGQLDPDTEPELVEKAIESRDAAQAAIDSGSYVNLEMLGFAYLIAVAKADSTGDSGIPYYSGVNFTNEQFVLFSLIYTNQLPGNWQFNHGFCAGDMENGSYYSPLEVIYEAGLNGKIYPIALERDFYDWYAGTYNVNLKRIKVPVEILNGELGIGGSRGEVVANKIREGGNEKVEVNEKPFGHIDLVYGGSAAQEAWEENL